MILHFIRPYWLLTLIPLILTGVFLYRKPPSLQTWKQICDQHLLSFLIHQEPFGGYKQALFMLLSTLLLIILCLSGPSFTRLPTPTYQQQLAHVILLDASNAMLVEDLPPNRLQRAKFKLHDLFLKHPSGQFGLIAYTQEPFIVSPLTDDTLTINALLPELKSEIMPVDGNRLDQALLEARNLIQQSGYLQGEVLVLTAEIPTPVAISTAHQLATASNIHTSVIPILNKKHLSPQFEQLAKSGLGHMIPYSDTTTDIEEWLKLTHHHLTFNPSQQDTVPQWRDEGRWFLIPALLLLLFTFRRHWLERIRP